jgi:hypothetical protein
VQRGNIGQMKHQEAMGETVALIDRKLDAIMAKLGVDPVSTMSKDPGFMVVVPEGVAAGQSIVVVNPADGQQVQVLVPEGMGPGSQFQVAV